MNHKFQYIIIIATSARMLVVAANKAGMKPLVIDIYADQETRNYATDFQQIPSFAKNDLLPAVDYFINKYAVTQAIYGSGLEQNVESLTCIAERLIVYGNRSDVFSNLQDKSGFFALLEKLAIPFPEVAFDLPNQDGDWLIKPVQGQGGIGIKRYKSGEISNTSVYWQKYQAGTPYSVLFLADGKRSQVIGFNRQWAVQLNSCDEFVFSGIINSTELSDKQKARISSWLDKLVPILSLKGLNSLDFIQVGEISKVLEINPRPSASMQLYDADLFNRHIKACQGELLNYNFVQTGYTAYQVVYAGQEIQIPHGFSWTDGAVDLPIDGSLISIGQPICSMITHGKEPQTVLQQLQKLQETIIYTLDRFKTHGI